MLSGTALAAVQQDTAYLANAVLRSDPVEILSAEKDFNGSTAERIADSPVFTDGSFTIEAEIQVNIIQQQSLFTKYNSGAGDQSFHFCMLKDGRLQFDVYGNPPSSSYLTFRTTGTPLAVGQWQSVRISFDLEHRQLAIMVDGQDVAGETIQTGADITAIHDGDAPFRTGGRETGGGENNYLKGKVRNEKFWPIASFEEKAQATDAVIEQVTETPTQEETITGEKQLTAESIDAVLRAEPVKLLEGTKEFNGSTVECIADSPIFTDGSFTVSMMVRPNVIKSQTFFSKYDSGTGDVSYGLSMLKDGRLDFCVCGNRANKEEMTMITSSVPLQTGIWQKLTVSFDIQKQKMIMLVDGQEVAGTLEQGQPITAIHDGETPMRLGVEKTGGGFGNFLHGAMRDVTLYPVAFYGIPEEAEEAAAKEPEEPVPAQEPAEAEAESPTANPTPTETAAEQETPLSLTERQLQQYEKRMAAASERFAAADAALKSVQQNVPSPQLMAAASAGASEGQTAEAQALTEWQIARRETIAYPAITAVEPHAGLSGGDMRIAFAVRYRSPDTASCMEVYLNGARVNVTNLSHPAGEPDGVFWFNPGDDHWHGDLEFRFSSGNDGQLRGVDRVTASYNTRESLQNVARVDSAFPALTSCDTGRLVDAPLPYDLKLMSAKGTSAVLHFTSPDDESLIVSSTGGMYGQELRVHPGGTSTGVAMLTLNPAKPGRYSFSLKDRNGMIRSSVWVDWNGSTLTPIDPAYGWTTADAATTRIAALAANAPEASAAERIAQTLSDEAAETLEAERLALLLEKQIDLTGITVSSMNLELGKVQAKNFYERSGLFLSMERMHEYFFTVHPDWRPENFQATVMRMWQEGGRNGPSGDTRDWLNGVIKDQMGRYDRDLNVYAAGMADIMQKGVEVCLAIRQGQPEGPLCSELEYVIAIRSGWDAVGRLAGIGAKLPSASQVLAECRIIIEQQIDELYRTQSEDQRLIQNYDLRQAYNVAWAAEHDGMYNVSVLNARAATGATQQEVSESEQRRLDRAARLYAQARYGNDARIQVVVAAQGQTNIQRERTLANGTVQITITVDEAEKLAEKVEEAIEESGGDAEEAGERVLVAMAGELETGTTAVVEERLEFGQKLEAFITINGDALSQRIGNALVNAIYHPSAVQTETQALSAFEWTGEYEQGLKSSYYVSRPLDYPVINIVASHTFIVTNAKYLGDPDATVFSFGHNDSGNLGMVDFCTTNESSAKTHSEDVRAWLALVHPESDEARRIDYTLIPVESGKVRALALSVMEDQDYAMFSGVFGINSNSAAYAIANHYSEVTEPSWRFAPGTGNADKISFGFFVRENGCGSGLYYGKELDSSPAF
jgi:hypothetical protein